MDEIDIAQDSEAHVREAAISMALRPPAGMEEGPIWVDGMPYCRECGGVIPARRLQAVPGTGLCVFCAEEAQAAGHA